jgi:hypothetical protein
MKIPNGLPQFQDEKVLLVVAGKQDAVLYEVGNQKIERVDAFKIPTPHYSDSEGLFKTGGSGAVARSGAAKEIQDEDIIRDFLHLFKERIKKMTNFSKIYVFASEQTKNRIVPALPYMLRRKVGAIFSGNYFETNPLELLRKIGIAKNKPTGPTNKEAKRILDTWDQARNFA